MLPDCLRSIEHAVDELIVVDTGSTDRTVEIAESFGAKVLHFPWIADFSAARNHGIDAATGDFIFWLDADERLEQQDVDQIRALSRQSWREGWWLVETNFTGQDETGAAATHMALRLFRNRAAHRFTGAIHEQITSQMPHDLGERFATTELRIRHYGYLKSRIDARDKHDRNLSLLREQLTRSPDDPFVHFNTGTEYMGLQEWARAGEHLERAFALLQHESGWEGRAYASLLVARLVGVRRVNGDPAGADELAAAMLQRFPGFTDLVFERALLARERGDTGTALELWQTCLQMGDAPARYAGTVGQGGFRTLQALSELARDEGDLDGARSLLERSLREHPTYLPAAFALTNLLLDAPDADPEGVLAALGEYGHEELTWWLFLGTAFYEHNHATIGEDMFRRSLAMAPNHPAARVGLGEALLTQHRYADVEAEQGDLPEGTLPYIAMQRARVLAGALAADDDAVADAISRLETGGAPPRDTRFMTAFAAAIGCREVGRDLLGAGATAVQMLDALARLEEFVAFERAVPLLEVAIGDELESSLVLGELYLRRGYYPLAAETAMETINRFGESARALALLGKAAVAEGLYDDALPVLEQAQRLEPGDSSVAYLIDELRARPAA